MKKVFALLTIVSVLSFVACKNKTEKPAEGGDTTNQEQVDADKAEATQAEEAATEATPTTDSPKMEEAAATEGEAKKAE